MAHRYSVKHWFVPTEHNQFHPHLLRTHSLAIVAGIMVFVQVLFNVSITGNPAVLGFATDINVNKLTDLTNQERTKDNLLPLTANAQLMQAAQAKADDMIQNNYWSHVSPSGKTPWTFFKTADYEYSYAGENLAKDFNTSAGVVSGWMNSPEHRSNILNNYYTDIGIAVKNGQIDGKNTTLVVALYGTPVQPFTLASIIPNVSAGSAATTSTSGTGSNWLDNINLATRMNWPQLAMALLLFSFIGLYLNDHRVKVKFSLPRHDHSHSLLQAAALMSALIILLVNSRFGMIN